MFTKGTRVFIQLPTGDAPGIVISDRVITEYRESKTTGRTYPVAKVEVLSYRLPTRVKTPYYTRQFEPVNFLFTRDEVVPAIDSHPVEELVAQADADRRAFNHRVQVAAQRAAVEAEPQEPEPAQLVLQRSK